MKEKLEIPVKICDLSSSLFEDYVFNIVEILQSYQKEYSNQKLYIRDDGIYDGPDYSLWYVRVETDDEFNARIKGELTKEQKKLEQQKKKAEAEFKKYQKLKEKYEKVNSRQSD